MWHPLISRELDRVFTTESRQKDECLFQLTHTPMRRLLVTHNRLGLTNGDFIGEQQLLELLQQTAPGDANRVWFLVGETGSGKSELCQWLEYHVKPSHVAIHISRRQANLSGILDVLNAHLPAGARLANTQLPAAMLADHLRLYLQLRAHREGQFEEEIASLLPHVDLLAQRYYHTGLRGEALLGGFPQLPEAFPLQKWLQGAAREVLGIHSLEETLRGVVEHYRDLGKRPVLLLEDITTLGFLRDDLLDYLFDLSAPGFDAVIGLTTGYEQSTLGALQQMGEMAYVRDRLSARLQLTQETGETFFLNEPGDMHDLVRRYLSCLPTPPLEGQHPVFEGLYPFTPIMLNRLYLHLQESGNSRQTPRNLLDAVIKPSLSMSLPPHQTLFEPHPYLRAPTPTFYRQGISPEALSLLYWHGVSEGEDVVVPPAVAAAFGQSDVPAVRQFHLPVNTPHLFHSARPVTDPEDEWNAALSELQNWRAGNIFPKRQVLKRGLTRLIQVLGNPRLVTHPHLHSSTADPIEYSRGSDLLPIYMPGSGDVLPEHWPSLYLLSTTDSQFLEECVTFGLSSTTHLEIFADPGHARELVLGMVAEFSASIQTYLSRLLGCTYETAVLGLWWLSQSLALAKSIDPATVQGRKELLQYDLDVAQIKRAWQEGKSHQVLQRTSADLIDRRRHYRALLLSIFHHRDDLIDTVSFERACAQFDAEEFIQVIKGLNPKQLHAAPFRQYQSGISLHDLFKPAHEFLIYLSNYSAAEQDKQNLKALILQLESLLGEADEYDRIARQIERLAQQLGFAVSAPASSHTWRHTCWKQVLRDGSTVFENGVPGILGAAVYRAWFEHIVSLTPLSWSVEIREFYALVHNMLVSREGGSRVASRPALPQIVSLNDFQALERRLTATVKRLEEVDPLLIQQFATSVDRLSRLPVPELAEVAQTYQRVPRTAGNVLQASCHLLSLTTERLVKS